MKKVFHDRAWEEYLYWQSNDKKIVSKINDLLKSIDRNGLSEGIGHPEPLKFCGAWSRRIDHANRLVYQIEGGDLFIISCKGHYDD